MTGDVITLRPFEAPFGQLAHAPRTLYTNLNHTYNDDIVDLVYTGKAIGQHAAWGFCGYVWFADGVWVETVMVYGNLVATYGCADLSTLIDHVISEHGDA